MTAMPRLWTILTACDQGVAAIIGVPRLVTTKRRVGPGSRMAWWFKDGAALAECVAG